MTEREKEREREREREFLGKFINKVVVVTMRSRKKTE
jgi:hypothetical protein